MISLEERRKMEKYRKKLEIINQIQIDREEEIQKFKDCLWLNLQFICILSVI